MIFEAVAYIQNMAQDGLIGGGDGRRVEISVGPEGGQYDEVKGEFHEAAEGVPQGPIHESADVDVEDEAVVEFHEFVPPGVLVEIVFDLLLVVQPAVFGLSSRHYLSNLPLEFCFRHRNHFLLPNIIPSQQMQT